ncbi:UvrD-helicase domain-containing protein [Rhodococcus sp. HNM0569]|uniref:UvrD-helicase domain-containing protein n=1 Tax=Rhodococcus sp. HNM0569 TaxID=2716340 RepID=UPI003211EE05
MSFDVTTPLPHGTTVLEASAGTGKTWTIVALATRYVAEGEADISQLLLVTFSRAATQELRERTRERFAATAAALAGPASARASDDPLVAHLATADDAEVEQRRRRLVRALADFDSGTIVTTHSFCQRMLDGLGVAGENDPDVTLVESVDDLTSDVARDLYLRAYARAEDSPPFSLDEAHQLARGAVADRQSALAPEPDDATVAGQRVLFARAARAEVDRRKKLSGTRDFEDLLALLHGVLADPAHGEAACARIRALYRVVLVDEFQDTDPLQWEIIRRVFVGHRTLILVGDPKQAIYAFRGAEVLSYLDAVAHAEAHEELSVNWRTDGPLIEALAHLYGGAALGHPDIAVHPVTPRHERSRIHGTVPLRVRYLSRTGAGPLGKTGFPAVGALRAVVATDVAHDIVRVLSDGITLDDGTAGERPVAPGDIAVLVRTRSQVELVRDALDRVGVPSVLAGGTSVFATESATHWLWVLQALGQPHRSDRVRLAALTPILGWTAERLDAESDDIVGRVGSVLREWAGLFERVGFAAVYERLSRAQGLDGVAGLEERVLAMPSGERTLTDIRHIAQLLGKVATEESMGLAELTRWLTERLDDPTSGSATDRSRRLDSDAAAVQIATVHASKGLEFPVVYLPFAWDASRNPYPTTLLLHGDDGRRVLDVGGRSGPGYAERRKVADAEEAGEELRLLYVALTRAKCHVVAWWAPSASTSRSALHRMLFGRRDGLSEPDQTVKVLDDGPMSASFDAWPASASAVISVEPARADTRGSGGWTAKAAAPAELVAARFDRELDTLWRRTSYSALTAAAHDHAAGTGSEPEEPQKDDEPEEPDVLAETPDETDHEGIASPLDEFPGGTAFGTLVHEVLEHVDTAVPDLAAELTRSCRDAVATHLAEIDPDALGAALVPVMHTPIGDETLASIAPLDRLPELDFELPLDGGDTPASGHVTIAGIAALMREYLPADDVLASYPAMLEKVESLPLRGYLTGSIDAVLRLPGPRYVVVDYKTNRLGRDALTTAHYTRERMAREMERSHYPLQALLYAVALHRYLRWRQPGYDPEKHLGGIRYLFVRGMAGPETPEGCGVFDWAPPASLVTALSDLLGGTP